jgi:hypothetical protein
MHPLQQEILRTRREFFTGMAGGGLGLLALRALLAKEERAHGQPPNGRIANPLRCRPPHFAPRARSCIFIFMDGGPSQLDLFDPKPGLRKYDGQRLPDSMLANVRFAFINRSATLRASSAGMAGAAWNCLTCCPTWAAAPTTSA